MLWHVYVVRPKNTCPAKKTPVQQKKNTCPAATAQPLHAAADLTRLRIKPALGVRVGIPAQCRHFTPIVGGRHRQRRSPAATSIVTPTLRTDLRRFREIACESCPRRQSATMAPGRCTAHRLPLARSSRAATLAARHRRTKGITWPEGTLWQDGQNRTHEWV